MRRRARSTTGSHLPRPNDDPSRAEAVYAPDGVPPSFDLVIPVYDEATILEDTVTRVRAAVAHLPYRVQITIADNASTDATPAIAARLAADHPDVRSLRIESKGRGGALRAAWSSSDADILGYTDADLSTRLDALGPLVAAVASGHSELAIGSRLLPGARIRRGLKREVISRSYNRILRTLLRVGVHDAQCGCKVIRAGAARDLLPLVEDDGWFFDTELIVAAERSGLRVLEVPVDWVDDPDSSVDIVATAREDMAGVWRLLRRHAHLPVPMVGRHAPIPVERSPAP